MIIPYIPGRNPIAKHGAVIIFSILNQASILLYIEKFITREYPLL